ncbi:hypothetical protein ABPG75_011201 [Micractinium tetrahymenae]
MAGGQQRRQADGVVNAAAAAAPPAPPAAPTQPPTAPAKPPTQGGTKVSPLVVKLQEAIQFCGAASGVPLEGPLARAGQATVVTAAVAGDASHTQAHLWWLAQSGTLVLAFKASDELDKMDDDNAPALGQNTAPFYLADPLFEGVSWQDTGALVCKPVADRLQGLSGELLGAAKALVPEGDLRNRADPRCITFDAFGAGNEEFKRVFDWLVPMAYRDDYEQQDGGLKLLRMGERVNFDFDLPEKKDRPRPTEASMELAEAAVDKEGKAPVLGAEGAAQMQAEEKSSEGIFNSAAKSFYLSALQNASPAVQASEE